MAHARRITREEWNARGYTLPYFDGQCEAQSVGNRRYASEKKPSMRCCGSVYGERQGMAVCYHHHRARRLDFIDPKASRFRGRDDS